MNSSDGRSPAKGAHAASVPLYTLMSPVSGSGEEQVTNIADGQAADPRRAIERATEQ